MGNHQSIFDSAGVEVKYFTLLRTQATNGLRFDDMMADTEAEAKAGDVLFATRLLPHPTGIDLQFDHWKKSLPIVNKPWSFAVS